MNPFLKPAWRRLIAAAACLAAGFLTFHVISSPGWIYYAIRVISSPGWTYYAIRVPITALAVAFVEYFPISINPTIEITLTSAVTLTSLALYGWTVAILGTLLGIVIISTILGRALQATLMYSLQELAAFGAAAVISRSFAIPGFPRAVSTIIIAAPMYGLVRTLVAAWWLHAREGIQWGRAFRLLVISTVRDLAILAGFAAAVVATTTVLPTKAWAPFLAGAVAVQFYLTRWHSGREEQRVLAAVSILANAVDVKDPYTANHSADVALLCRRIARILGLDEQEVHWAYLTGLLHDVGKITTPLEILLKPGRLTPEERSIMQRHVEDSAEIVRSIGGLAHIAPIVAASHEHLDGSGYPAGLRGEAIPLGARINLAVDAYNALTTDRPYRRARSREAAFQELEAHAGTQFDPRVVAALHTALEGAMRHPAQEERKPAWLAVLRKPAYALLWVGELVSFLGDEVFFIALSLWVYQLTQSVTILATALVAGTIGQALLGFVAGAMADRVDRRGMIIATDLGRAAIVAILPLVLPRSIPAGLMLLFILNVGAVFFRSAIFALIPSVVEPEMIGIGTALFQATERIAEVAGGVLGGAVVLLFGFKLVFYADALTFLVSAVSVGLMPVAWRAGLGGAPFTPVLHDIRAGLRYMWSTPLQRYLALLIVPGYLTLGFSALQAPMVVTTAHLSAMAYGITNSALGLGKLAGAIALTVAAGRWATKPFVVWTFLLTAAATILFGATSSLVILIVAAFLYGLGNVSTLIANATLVMSNTPSEMLGRVLGNRQGLLQGVKVVALFGFGALADRTGPPFALWALGLLSIVGTLGAWLWSGRRASFTEMGAADSVSGL